MSVQDEMAPGAARFGNFINYYQFNRPEARLNELPDDDLLAQLMRSNDGRPDTGAGRKQIVCLDVGCNTGEMTVALRDRLSNENVDVDFLAIDLDGNLIQRALGKASDGDITFRCLDIMDVDKGRAACYEYLRTKGRERFDVCFCLSVTMWIHLNHGDEGLDDFLTFVASVCDSLLVEPQPWKCYKAASRRMRRVASHDPDFFERLSGLRVRCVQEHIDRVLTQSNGMVRWTTFGLTPWKRPLILYKRPP